MPTYISPFKQNAADVADGVHRLAMCRLAIAPYPCFSVSDYELQQKTVSYTIHTISALRQEWTDVELVLLMGSDMLLQFQNWYRWQELLTMTELGVIARETDDRVVLEQAAQELLSAAHLDHLKEKLYDSGDWSALLSGGEQQRLSLLRALIVKPDILLLDEMTSGLDPANAHWMIALLKAKLPQTAMLLVTHQQSLWPLADHIINLQGPAHGQSVHSVSQM